MPRFGLSKSGLLVPGAPQRERTHKCRICKADLTADEYQTHVVNCADRHENELREASLRERLPDIYDPDRSTADEEFISWVRRNGRVR